MSLWEFRAATGGYAKAHASDDGAISSEEAASLAVWLDAPPIWH